MAITSALTAVPNPPTAGSPTTLSVSFDAQPFMVRWEFSDGTEDIPGSGTTSTTQRTFMATGPVQVTVVELDDEFEAIDVETFELTVGTYVPTPPVVPTPPTSPPSPPVIPGGGGTPPVTPTPPPAAVPDGWNLTANGVVDVLKPNPRGGRRRGR